MRVTDNTKQISDDKEGSKMVTKNDITFGELVFILLSWFLKKSV